MLSGWEPQKDSSNMIERIEAGKWCSTSSRSDGTLEDMRRLENCSPTQEEMLSVTNLSDAGMADKSW